MGKDIFRRQRMKYHYQSTLAADFDDKKQSFEPQWSENIIPSKNEIPFLLILNSIN